MIEIPVRHRVLKLVSIVDDADYDKVMRYKWQAHRRHKNGNVYDAVCQIKCINISLATYLMGKVEGLQIDHINGNVLDNRRCNLRFVTRRQNCWNRTRYNKTGFKGVFKNGYGFTARIVAEGVRKYLGYFSTVVEAAKAYDKAAKFHFGPYARLNFN